MRNGWVLQKGLKLWPQDLCRRELHLPNVTGKWSKDLINSSMNYLSRESWDTESCGTFWLQETKSGFAHCKPGPLWSFFFFLPGCKAMPRRNSSCRNTASLWPDLPPGVILCMPTAACGVRFLKPNFHRTVSEACWKLEPESSCKSIHWWAVPQRAW